MAGPNIGSWIVCSKKDGEDGGDESEDDLAMCCIKNFCGWYRSGCCDREAEVDKHESTPDSIYPACCIGWKVFDRGNRNGDGCLFPNDGRIRFGERDLYDGGNYSAGRDGGDNGKDYIG